MERLCTGGRLRIDELRDGIRIEARSWVGVVRLTNFEIQVRPKLAGDNIGLVGMLEYVAGLDRLRRFARGRTHTLDAGADSLLELIALLFADSCERLVRGVSCSTTGRPKAT